MNLIDIVQFCNLLTKSTASLNPAMLKLIADTFENQCKLQNDKLAKTLSLMLNCYLKIAEDKADERFIKFILLQLVLKQEPLSLESCIRLVGALPLIKASSSQMQNMKRNIVEYVLT